MEAEVYLIQPRGRKTGRSSFSRFPFTDPAICATALALQTGKCQSQINLPPKVLCARFSAQRYQDPGQFYFKWNTHTKQTFSRSSRCTLSVLWQEPFSLFRKRPRTHLCLRTVNSMEKNLQRIIFLKKHTWYCVIIIYEIINYGRGGCCSGLPPLDTVCNVLSGWPSF